MNSPLIGDDEAVALATIMASVYQGEITRLYAEGQLDSKTPDSSYVAERAVELYSHLRIEIRERNAGVVKCRDGDPQRPTGLLFMVPETEHNGSRRVEPRQ